MSNLNSRLGRIERVVRPRERIVIILPEHTGDRADGERTFASDNDALDRWPDDKLFMIKIVYSDEAPGLGSEVNQS